MLSFKSCKNSDNSFKLTGKNYKFWDITSQPGYSYKFSNTGECRYYYYRYKDGKGIRKLFPFDDLIVTEKWNFVNDSIIKIQDFTYKFKFINDTLIRCISSKRLNDTSYLTVSKYQ